ncbi:TauD/TfdA family dioxygenase [Nocardia sp. BMG51109]|uniref:TauD/TfdA family dioxygenase n=1 Tax=Nocardia sp. BMG51109 TaxID=1056816 RepID=UPI0004663D79|nr:TauD/TfdA family dioxygenase [Nocardia sp. BMG51109]
MNADNGSTNSIREYDSVAAENELRGRRVGDEKVRRGAELHGASDGEFSGHCTRHRKDSARLAPDEVVTVTERAAAAVWAAASRAARGTRAGRDPVDLAAGLIPSLPRRMVVALHRFRAVGSEHNALLLRGVCPDLTDLPATPATVTPEEPMPVVEAAALLLLAVSLPLGEPFTFRSLHGGRLVQHVTPVPGREETQTGAGSVAALEWHVEDGFTDDRCDYFGLLCLRGHPGAVTMLASARDLDLAVEAETVLREPRFVIAPDAAHQLTRHIDLPAVPVLTGPATDPEICFGEGDVRPADPADLPAAAALTALTAALDRAAIGHELRPGDLLIADNRRTVHGRSIFQPRYDGTDRWLLRAMTCSSIRAHRRRGATRALG